MLEIPQLVGKTLTHETQCLSESGRTLIWREDLTQWQTMAHRQGQHLREQTDAISLTNDSLRFEEGHTRRDALKNLRQRTHEALPAVRERFGGGPLAG
jgi:hypothetical protein